MNSSDPGPLPQITSLPLDVLANSHSAEPRTLKPKDLEAIQRLWRTGARQAAMKLYSGAMDCGMTEAARAIKQLNLNGDL